MVGKISHKNGKLAHVVITYSLPKILVQHFHTEDIVLLITGVFK